MLQTPSLPGMHLGTWLHGQCPRPPCTLFVNSIDCRVQYCTVCEDSVCFGTVEIIGEETSENAISTEPLRHKQYILNDFHQADGQFIPWFHVSQALFLSFYFYSFSFSYQAPLTPNSTSPLPHWEEADLEELQLRQKLHEMTDNISDHSLTSDEDEPSRPQSSQEFPAWRSTQADLKPSRIPTRPTSRASTVISRLEEEPSEDGSQKVEIFVTELNEYIGQRKF